MFAVGVFFNYNYTIWQFFADLIFVDFQKIAKSAKKIEPCEKRRLTVRWNHMFKDIFDSCYQSVSISQPIKAFINDIAKFI